jgi:hypothetical protein
MVGVALDVFYLTVAGGNDKAAAGTIVGANSSGFSQLFRQRFLFQGAGEDRFLFQGTRSEEAAETQAGCFEEMSSA